MKAIVSAMAMALVSLVGAASAQPAGAVYVAGEWNANNLVYLDSGMNVLGSFPSGGTLPNGLAGDSQYIYAGFFTNGSVSVFTHAGTPVTSWTGPLSGLQGLAKVGNNLAVQNGALIEYYDALTGTPMGSIPSFGFTIEGLAYLSGSNTLYQLGDNDIFLTDPTNGNILGTIPNPAVNSNFGGTAFTDAGSNQLMVGDSVGNWWRIDGTNGNVLASGNNGVSMFGLGTIPAPGSALLLGVAGLAASRRRRA